MRAAWFLIVIAALGSLVACSSDSPANTDTVTSGGIASSTGGISSSGGTNGTGATISTGTGAAMSANTGGSTVGSNQPDSGSGMNTGGQSNSGTDGSVPGMTADGTSVLQHHNHASRDGVYVDPLLTKAAVSSLHIDTSFANAMVNGPVYAQPLYLAGTSGKPDQVLVVTEQNQVISFNASDGSTVWSKSLGTPFPKSQLPCGNIDPLGITSTPVIDGTTRIMYLDAMISDGGTAHHQVFALDADTGDIQSGFPVDMNATAQANNTTFDSLVQNQRGALVLLDGYVFVPFGGHYGDCGTYHGWIVGISTSDPTQVRAWVTRGIAGGVWEPGGIASDGTSLFFVTGNTENNPNQFSAPPTWQDGDAVFRLPSSLVFSGDNADYFVPSNWQTLDITDQDIAGCNPVLFDVPGATPSKLVIALGKDGKAYLLDRDNMGGIGSPLAGAQVANGPIINAPAAYTTPSGTFVVYKGNGNGCPGGQSGGLAAVQVSAAAPPAVSVAWCGGPTTVHSPAVSMSDAQGSDAIVWIVGTDYKLHGLDANTGESVFDGGSTAMSTVQGYQTPIVVDGRIFVAANNQVYAFTL